MGWLAQGTNPSPFDVSFVWGIMSAKRSIQEKWNLILINKQNRVRFYQQSRINAEIVFCKIFSCMKKLKIEKQKQNKTCPS